MEGHNQVLKSTCRVCGRKRDISSLRTVTSASSLIKKVYGHDISTDVSGIHPSLCCLSCLNILRRCVKFKQKKGGPRPSKKIPGLQDFQPHGEGCSLCEPHGPYEPSQEAQCEMSDEISDYDTSTEEDDPQTKKKQRMAYIDAATQTEMGYEQKTLLQTHRRFSHNETQTQSTVLVLDLANLDETCFNDLSPEFRFKLSHALGKSQNQNIKTESMNLSSGKDLDSLINLDLYKFLRHCNIVVVGFLLGISNKNVEFYNTRVQYDETTLYTLCKSVESVLNLSAYRCIMPLHFRESLLIYSITGSRLALSVLASGSSHGGYLSVRKFLSDLAENSSEETLPGNIMYVFDNNQILHRSWNVNLEKKFMCHIVTMVAQFALDKDGTWQWKEDMRPGIWMLKETPNTKTVRKLDQEREVRKLHYDEHLYPFLRAMITEVATEQQETEYNKESDSSVFMDDVDRCIEKKKKEQNFKSCHACGAQEIPKAKIKCPLCKQNLKQAELKAQGLTAQGTWEEKKTTKQSRKAKKYRISFYEEQPDTFKVEVKEMVSPSESIQDINEYRVGEPVFVNPCSYEACTVVMRKIGHKAGVKVYGGEREVVCICCDGSPYVLCSRLILSTFLCTNCRESCDGIGDSDEHKKAHIGKGEQCQMVREFDWVLLIPGPGHLEMNMVRAFVELTWEIFWRPLAHLMNFKSDTALRAAKRVSDHHKGWQFCIIAREALVKELVLPWVRQQLQNSKPDLSPDTFLKFVMGDVRDHTYVMIADLVFEILDAIFMYREGIRDEMPEVAYAARAKIAKLWSGRSHPSYREIEMTDSIMLSRMPVELRERTLKCWSVNTSGRKGTSEGGDFKLEQINKQTQAWLPKVPSGQDWKTVCLNYNSLSGLREKTLSQLGIKDPKAFESHKQKTMGNEIKAFRALIREKEYLSHPEVKREVVSLEGQKLSNNLVKFCDMAREIRAQYFDKYIEYEQERTFRRSNVPFSHIPVFVTTQEEDEYRSVHSRTVNELKAIISEKIQQVADSEAKDAFESAFQGRLISIDDQAAQSTVSGRKTKKRLLKSDYIELFEELQEYLDFQDNMAIPPEMEENDAYEDG